MRKQKADDKYGDEEAQHRFEAALRGARAVGHETMKDIVGKSERAIAQRENRIRKAARSKPKSP